MANFPAVQIVKICCGKCFTQLCSNLGAMWVQALSTGIWVSLGKFLRLGIYFCPQCFNTLGKKKILVGATGLEPKSWKAHPQSLFQNNKLGSNKCR